MKISSLALHRFSVLPEFFEDRYSPLMPKPENSENFFSVRLVKASDELYFSLFGR
jgi:hypothetical protein